jgi:hypothetical protein
VASLLSLLRPSNYVDSSRYWDDRYTNGGNSGDGSYGYLARFKAAVVNGLIEHHNIRSVLDFGPGDGNQLSLLETPDYIGVDISDHVIASLRERFGSDAGKRFFLVSDLPTNAVADMTLSLDVIYHLVEDDVYLAYLDRLFATSKRLVCIYSSNSRVKGPAPHVRHRHFSKDVQRRHADWTLTSHLRNPFYPRSFAEFFVYERASS